MSAVLKDFDLDAGTLEKVNDFVDDDLLSCFLWAAGENAVAQPGWESPSVNPLKGIPLPPLMPPLPPAVSSPGASSMALVAAGFPSPSADALPSHSLLPMMGDMGSPLNSDDDSDAGLDDIKGLDDDDIDDLTKMRCAPALSCRPGSRAGLALVRVGSWRAGSWWAWRGIGVARDGRGLEGRCHYDVT